MERTGLLGSKVALRMVTQTVRGDNTCGLFLWATVSVLKAFIWELPTKSWALVPWHKCRPQGSCCFFLLPSPSSSFLFVLSPSFPLPPSLPFFLPSFCKRYYYATQSGLNITIPLPQFLKCSDSRNVSSHLRQLFKKKKPKYSNYKYYNGSGTCKIRPVWVKISHDKRYRLAQQKTQRRNKYCCWHDLWKS